MADTAVGATIGKFVPDAAVKGVANGVNSAVAVFKSGITKLTNGTAQNMSAGVIAKGVAAGVVGGSTQTLASETASRTGIRETVGTAIDEGAEAVACDVLVAQC